jgi:hypothetical protein
MPLREITQLVAAALLFGGGLYCLRAAWNNYPPSRERLTELRVTPRDFGTAEVRVGAARGHGGGILVVDVLTVAVPGQSGLTELTPPRRVVLKSMHLLGPNAPLSVLADVSGGRFYHVAGKNDVYLDYATSAPTSRQNALVALLMTLGALYVPAAIGWKYWHRARTAKQALK